MVTSDPNIEKIERLSGEPISLSDYANQEYIPNPRALSPEIVRFCKDFLRGDLAPAVDTGVVARIAALAQTGASKIEVQGARDLRLSEVYTDTNFIFLGSPRSNRWASLFNNQLDFRFELNAGQEIIRNMHPRSDEKSVYVPTAGGYATGQSFATITFLPNPGQNGHILLLAGANGEGHHGGGGTDHKQATAIDRVTELRNQAHRTGQIFPTLTGSQYDGGFAQRCEGDRMPHLAW